jgi:ribose 1,5-bisphosphokinase PhnN
MPHTARLMVVVGSPGSGKDKLVRAIGDLGAQHATVVSKHTSRYRRIDDGDEMICANDEGFNINECDIIYENYEDKYGIQSKEIWKGLRKGVFQVIVVSNIEAINKLRSIFGKLSILVYVHSAIMPEEYKKSESSLGSNIDYVIKRTEKYSMAFENFLLNFNAFDHVLIYTDAAEDLYDQIFRLFRAYERQWIA